MRLAATRRPGALPLHYPAGAGGRAAAVPAAEDGRTRLYLGALMLAAVSYQLWLVAVNTHLHIGGNAVVMVSEMAMLAACLPLLARRVPVGLGLVVALVFANALALALVRQSFDPKSIRDLLVPLVFLWAGMNTAGEREADRVLRWAIGVVLAVGLFEYFFVDAFTRFFDVYSYYIARGVGDPNMGMYRDDKLVASGMRPEDMGRTILPFLGEHRVSSVFIEPVSLGNFAVILAGWGLAKDRWREGLPFVAAAAVMIVLADSRFGLATVALLVVLRFALVRGAEPAAIAFPLAAAGGLVALALATHGVQYSDSFLGRLMLTGRTLMRMDGPELLGLRGDLPSYADMGYPYVLSNFGILACLLLWGALWHLPVAGAPGQRFRVAAALYLSLILCVSGTSVFAFKTSAILWFLLGTLAAPAAAAGATRARGQGAAPTGETGRAQPARHAPWRGPAALAQRPGGDR